MVPTCYLIANFHSIATTSSATTLAIHTMRAPIRHFARPKSTSVPHSNPGQNPGIIRQVFDSENLSIPVTTQTPPVLKQLAYSFLNGQDEETRTLLAKFILPCKNGDEEIQKEAIPALPDTIQPLFSNFNVNPKHLLPLTKPSYIKQSPFEFHSMFNADPSYLSVPRLSVTKLLTTSWCELREFYLVYSGSPSFKKTTQMKLGSEYHSGLEEQTHKVVDMQPFVMKVDDLLLQNEFTEEDREMINQGAGEAELADIWLEKIVVRLFSLLTRSEARELVVHGYLNLIDGKYITKLADIKSTPFSNNKVLVSAIIDHIKLTNKYDENDLDFFVEINDYIETQFENGVIEFDKFLNEVHEIINKYSDELEMTISDVKTRSFNKIPQQDSVVEAAKLQVSHYKTMLDTLSQKGVSYNLFNDNALRRNLDIDQPLGIKHVLMFLIRNYELVYDDFEKLSQGKPIGVAAFDDYYKESTREFPGYSFKTLLGNDHTKEQLNKLCLEMYDKDLDKLIPPSMMNRQWQIPVTLTYISGRINSLFDTLGPVSRDKLSIEYHNVRTGVKFSQRSFKFNETKFAEQVDNSSKFWSGRKPYAEFTDDLSKCKYCDFSSKCPIPNQKETIGDQSIGNVVLQFINSR